MLVQASHPIGKQWILFINNVEQNWQHICELGKEIRHTDELIWKFQYPQVQSSLSKPNRLSMNSHPRPNVKNIAKIGLNGGTALLKKINLPKKVPS